MSGVGTTTLWRNGKLEWPEILRGPDARLRRIRVCCLAAAKFSRGFDAILTSGAYLT